MTERRCDTCQWWGESWERSVAPAEDEERDCHRFPPVPVVETSDVHYFAQPRTKAQDWCAEHTPIQTKQKG